MMKCELLKRQRKRDKKQEEREEGVRIAIKVQPLLHTKFKSLSSEFYVPVCNCADCLT